MQVGLNTWMAIYNKKCISL